MKNSKSKNNNILFVAYELLIIIAFLFSSGTGLQVIFPKISSYLLLVSSILSVGLASFVKSAKKRNILFFMFPFLIIVLGSFLVNWDITKVDQYIVLCSTILLTANVAIIFDKEIIIDFFVRLLFGISIISLINYIILNTLGYLPFFNSYKSINIYTYNTIYLFNWIDGLIDRNCGIFWEPGIFASFIVMAMQFELFGNRRKNYIFIFILTLITCNSSAGFLLLLILIIELIMLKKKKNPNNNRIKSLFNFLIFLSMIIIVLNLDNIILPTSLKNNDYIKKLTFDSISNNTRSKSIEYNLNAFKKNPVFGNGLSSSISFLNGAVLTPDTTTSFYLLNTFGIGGILYTIFYIVGLLKTFSKKNSVYKIICLLLIFLIILNKETHYIISFTWLVLFMLQNDNEIKCNMREGREINDQYN